MPKRHQQRQAKEQVGRNNPTKSTVITTGTPRKKETVREEAREHKDTGKTAQEVKVPRSLDPTEGRSKEAESQVMEEEREKRSGSDSNANKHRKSSRVHDSHKYIKQPVGVLTRRMTLMMTCALITSRLKIMVKVLHLKLG